MKNQLEEIVEPLLLWYQNSHRDLPWRKDKNPYHVWVSEIMLQQTRVEAVKEYYRKFMEALSDVSSLASVEEETLLKLWEGLGYYNRARNLKKAAIEIEKRGSFPTTYDDLLTLPGIGDYTAGAIASICFLEPIPAVDGNVLRVISRILGSRADIASPKTKEMIKELLVPILPKQVDLFNQALMELGALICLPNGDPLCSECPVRESCQAYLKHLTDVLPVKSKKQKRRIEERVVLLITDQDHFVLEKRPEEGLLASLYQFPNYLGVGSEIEILEHLGPLRNHVLRLEYLKENKHIFSHIEWHMKPVVVILDQLPKEGYLWVTMEELEEHYPLPGAFVSAKEQLKDWRISCTNSKKKRS